jgi:hypothetical protein
VDEPDLPAKSEEEDDGYDESPKSTMLRIVRAMIIEARSGDADKLAKLIIDKS